MLNSKRLEDVIDRRVLTGKSLGGSVDLVRGKLLADTLWLELSGTRQPWKFSSELISAPVYDDAGARYYGDDLLTLLVEPAASTPEPSARLVTLYTQPVVAVELYGGTLRSKWVDKGLLLRLADGAALLIHVETSCVTLSCSVAAIAETLAEWDNDWPEIRKLPKI